jgi:hypothetical protein
MPLLGLTRALLALALSLAPFALFACGGDAPAKASLPKSDVPESFYLASAPANPTTPLLLRTQPHDGQVVSVRGRAMDFFNGLSAFRLIDSELKSCADAGEKDHCPTPWDYCCNDPKDVSAAVITVELKRDGQLLRSSVHGFHGLDHLMTVTVRGKLTQDASGNLTLAAEGLHVGS